MTAILQSHAFGDAVLAMVIAVFGGTIIGLLIHIVRCAIRDEREYREATRAALEADQRAGEIHQLAETVRRAQEVR